MEQLVLIRGLPGSGKSTLSKTINRDMFGGRAYIFEDDDYFTDKDGNYNFVREELDIAHQLCRANTFIALHKGYNVIVPNTFTTFKELSKYFEMAKTFKITPQVILCQNNFGDVHNIKKEAIQRMRDRFIFDVSPLFEEMSNG